MSVKPTLFLILDGYGLAPAGPGNAAYLANTPTLDRLFSLPGVGRLDASGRQVGLPSGFIGFFFHGLVSSAGILFYHILPAFVNYFFPFFSYFSLFGYIVQFEVQHFSFLLIIYLQVVFGTSEH